MISELISALIMFLVTTIGSWGYLGIFLLMTIESTFIPFPSELILVPAGILIALGEMTWTSVILIGTLGSLVGASINYYIAYCISKGISNKFLDGYSKIFLISAKGLEKTEKYFKKHGEITIFVGRLIPIIRQLISIPAGFARMNFLRFSLFTTIGAAIWVFILTYLGFIFGNNLDLLQRNVSMLTTFAITFAVALVLVYIIWNKRLKNNKA
ncbi:DedA family protein [Candidatus Woesearchaeota archaeon]|jgi:membrane protein DedA with SNARE-associated domain|nr:DedA family protein [Candidatus Woesearchaeota archaeon]MBT6044981.1 DedA family protein [Candidatus Woesearchaeota archaeon]